MFKISKSEYARFRGVTPAAISKACRLGKVRTIKVPRMIEMVVLTDAEYQQWQKAKALK